MELHYKVTAWCKLKFEGDINPEHLIKELQKGIEPIEVIFDSDIPNLENPEWEMVSDTDEYLYPEENENQSTIELLNDDNEIIWSNEKIIKL